MEEKKMQNRTARNQINFRVDDEEYAILKSKAEMAGLSPTMYAKKQAIQGKVKSPVITKDIGSLILPEISKIGSNINQIARKLNQGGKVLPSEYREILAEFETLWAYVLEGKKPRPQKTGMKEEKQEETKSQDGNEKEKQEEQKPEISSSSPSEAAKPPHCKLCGAEMVAGNRSKDNSPIWFCPNWRDQEQGKHSILER